jgi:excisionase family DNA binding protein
MYCPTAHARAPAHAHTRRAEVHAGTGVQTPAAKPLSPTWGRRSARFARGAVVSDPDRLLTAEELAERWSVAPAHVYRLARAHRIPTIRIGRYTRFRLASIVAWETEQEALADA